LEKKDFKNEVSSKVFSALRQKREKALREKKDALITQMALAQKKKMAEVVLLTYRRFDTSVEPFCFLNSRWKSNPPLSFCLKLY
jgi:hypothetical protein